MPRVLLEVGMGAKTFLRKVEEMDFLPPVGTPVDLLCSSDLVLGGVESKVYLVRCALNPERGGVPQYTVFLNDLRGADPDLWDDYDEKIYNMLIDHGWTMIEE